MLMIFLLGLSGVARGDSQQVTTIIRRLEHKVDSLLTPVWNPNERVDRWHLFCAEVGRCSCVDTTLQVDCKERGLDTYQLSEIPIPQDTLFLDLGGNSFPTLHQKTFHATSYLMELDISAAHLEYLPPLAFHNLKRLSKFAKGSGDTAVSKSEEIFPATLNLARNKLWEISAKLFEGLTSLVYLDLSFNTLGPDVEPKAFRTLKSLKFLNLDHNKFADFDPLILHNLTALENLDLSGNLIEELDSGILQEAKSIENLNLASNLIRRLQPLKSSKLRRLDLSSNQIATLELGVFEGVRNLKELNLGKNKLTLLPDSLFCHNFRLLELNLGSNYLEKVTWDNLNGLSSLLVIKLNGNLLTDFKNDTFWELKRLATLDLNHNILAQLPSGLLANAPGIKTIRLGWNNFKSLNTRMFEHLEYKITNLEMEGNPWTCDCPLWNILDNLLENNVELFQAFDAAVCHSPADLVGRSLYSFWEESSGLCKP